jgi:hypothetical protein
MKPFETFCASFGFIRTRCMFHREGAPAPALPGTAITNADIRHDPHPALDPPDRSFWTATGAERNIAQHLLSARKEDINRR